jgi:integrase
VGDQFGRCLRRAGLPHRNFHQLRHQAATVLLALNGGNIHEEAQILGHSSHRMTADLYGHLQPEVMELRAAQVDAYYSRLAAGAPHGVA